MSSQVTTLLGGCGLPADNLLTQRKSLPEPVPRLHRRTLHTLSKAEVILIVGGAFGL